MRKSLPKLHGRLAVYIREKLPINEQVSIKAMIGISTIPSRLKPNADSESMDENSVSKVLSS